MVISIFPAASSSPIKSIQRGVAATSGNITISSVNTAKTQVTSFSTAASGTVAGSGTLSAANGTVITTANQNDINNRYGILAGSSTHNTTTRNIALNSTNFSGGSTNLTSAAFGVYLSDATTLVATGACRYEVIEYV
jgi:hypothetical protein